MSEQPVAGAMRTDGTAGPTGQQACTNPWFSADSPLAQNSVNRTKRGFANSLAAVAEGVLWASAEAIAPDGR